MEDAATAEICRSQIWQWVRNGSTLEDGTVVTNELVRDVLDTELEQIRRQAGDRYGDSRFELARDIVEQVALADDFADFLTLPAYAAVSASPDPDGASA